MKKNLESSDAVIRIAIAILIAILYLSGTITGTIAIVALVLAGVLVVTSFIGFCPLYTPFGIDTSKKRR